MQQEKSTSRKYIMSPDKLLNPSQPSGIAGSGRGEAKIQYQDKKRMVQFTPQNNLEKHRKPIQSGDSFGKCTKSQQENQKRKSSSSNHGTPEKIQKTPGSGKIVDTLIEQWSKHTGQQTPGAAVEMNTDTKECANKCFRKYEYLQVQHTFPDEENQDLMFENGQIKILQKKLRIAEETVSSLYVTHEAELRSKAEIQKKMNENWEAIEMINKYCNDVSESVSGFQQLHAELSTMYDNVISVQQSNIKKLEQGLENMKQKDGKHMKLLSEAEKQILNQEKRIQEMITVQNELKKELERTENKSMLEKNRIESNHTEEKLKLIKEQEELVSAIEMLKLQLKRMEEDHRCKSQLVEEKNMEISKLQDENRNSQNKIENLLCQTSELTMKNEELMRKEVELSKQVHAQRRVSESLAHKEKEIAKLKDEIFNSQDKIGDLLRKNTELTTKNEKLIQMEKELSKQFEEQRRISESLEKKEKEIAELKEEIFKNQTKVDDLLRQNAELSMKNEKLLHMEKELSNQVQEYRRVSELLEQKEKENSKLNDKIFNNQSKIEELLSKTVELSKENESLVQMESQLSTKLQLTQEQMSKLHENLNTRLEIESSLAKEFNMFENKFANQEAEYKKLQNNFTNVEKDLKNAHARNVNLENQIRDLRSAHEHEILELDKKIQVLEKEKQKIISEQRTKGEAKHKLEVSTLREEYEAKFTEIKETITVQNSNLHKKDEENQSLREIIEQLKERNNTLEAELQKSLKSSTKSDTRSVTNAYETQIRSSEHNSKSTEHKTTSNVKSHENKLDSLQTNIELEVFQTPTQEKSFKNVKFDLSSRSKSKTFDDIRNSTYRAQGKCFSQGAPGSTSQLEEKLEPSQKKFFKSGNRGLRQYNRTNK